MSKSQFQKEYEEYQKYKEWQEVLCCKNAQEVIDFVMSNYLTEDEKCKTIAEQSQRIAELEERLKNAITLPVKIGDKIYVVPSETNFKINNIHHKERNRIYEWEVHEIRFNKYGYAVVSWIDNIPFFCVDVETGKYNCGTYKTERFYGETWFKTRKEAQAKLEELKGE